MDKNQLYALLKAKAKQYGFDKEEMEEVVDALLQTFQLDDDATEDDWNAKIDAVLPMLGVGQKMANRLVKAQQKKAEQKPQPTKDQKPTKSSDGDVDENGEEKSGSDNSKSKNLESVDSNVLSILKAMKAQLDETKAELVSMKADKVATSRKDRLTKAIDVESAYGKSLLKTFDKLKFDDDAEFDEWLEGAIEVNDTIKQNLNDSKLDTMSKPAGGAKKDPKNLATDAEIESLSKRFA